MQQDGGQSGQLQRDASGNSGGSGLQRENTTDTQLQREIAEAMHSHAGDDAANEAARVAAEAERRERAGMQV